MLTKHKDDRGVFVELLKNAGGQVSFSTSLPDVTRGNHYHETKWEQFIVVAGRAMIRLRRIGAKHIDSQIVDGDRPTAVDIPPMYVHNITNIGDNVMYLILWSDTIYDPENPDTIPEAV